LPAEPQIFTSAHTWSLPGVLFVYEAQSYDLSGHASSLVAAHFDALRLAKTTCCAWNTGQPAALATLRSVQLNFLPMLR